MQGERCDQDQTGTRPKFAVCFVLERAGDTRVLPRRRLDEVGKGR